MNMNVDRVNIVLVYQIIMFVRNVIDLAILVYSEA